MSRLKKIDEGRALETIKRLVDENGFAPTVAELGAALGVTKGGAQCVLDRLATMGRVTWIEGKARTLKVL